MLAGGKGEQPPRRKRKHRSRKLGLFFIALLAVAIVSALYSFSKRGQPDSNPTELSSAAIIDQLSSSFPNSTFWNTANIMFRENAWSMHYYSGGISVDTVNFYRSLPQYGFKIIILRVHAALNPETGTLAIFTGEEWDDRKVWTDYLSDFDPLNPSNNRLAKVRITENSTAYFGITPNFVKAMKGNFQNTTIIMMGCDGLTNTRMAEAFIEKGARAYVAWTGPISAGHTDTATQNLLEHLITENRTIAMAVAETIGEVGKDPAYGSILSYYPSEAGEYTPQMQCLSRGEKHNTALESSCEMQRNNCYVAYVNQAVMV
jgi:hypothetical protein